MNNLGGCWLAGWLNYRYVKCIPGSKIDGYKILTKLTSLLLSTMMVGLIEETGRFPGPMSLAAEAAIPYESTDPGIEKSSICQI